MHRTLHLFGQERAVFNLRPMTTYGEGGMSCEDLHDTQPFGLNNESYPVQRNEYAWGYNENDRRRYGGLGY